MTWTDDLLWYIDEALDDLVAVLEELGDERANQRLDEPGSNSPYAVLTHCCGVLEYWGGGVIAGRAYERDRAAEFRASGPVDQLVASVRRARRQLRVDCDLIQPDQPNRGDVHTDDLATPVGRTQGGTLLHIYQELAQHLGQVQVTRDVLVAGSS